MNREALSRSVRGAVLEPEDPGYEEARTVWNVRFDRRPDVIVRCAGPADVQAAVNYAREEDLLLSVKSGGHAYGANTVGDGGVLVDLSPMNDVQVDPDARIARVGPGATWGALDGATQEFGLATPGAVSSTAGIGGVALGGGTGYLSRQFGLTLDNVLDAEVVTADGRRVRASPTENPDLFWGLRGGGGNFGVVTSFTFRLHEVGPEILLGQIVHRFEDASAVIRHYRDFMEGAPDAIQCYAFVLRVPPVDPFPEAFHGEIALDLVVFHSDPHGEAAIQSLRDFGDPILDAVGPLPYTAAQQAFDDGLPAGHRYASRSHFLPGLSDEAIDAFVAGIGDLPAPVSLAYLAAEGGAISRVDPSATPYYYRDAAYFHALAGWDDPAQEAESVSWAAGFQEAMAPHATGGVYVNLLDAEEGDRVPAAYGGNYDRLVELKKKWDPENRFRMNHNVEPAG